MSAAIESLLNSEPAQVYKADARSRVWRVNGPDGPVVFKRFEYSPWRQLLALLVRRHPAQRERRRIAQMSKAGVPVAELIGTGIQWREAGVKVWLATRCHGRSLQELLRDPASTAMPRPQRIVAIERIAHVVAELIDEGWFFRDLKTSNIVIDDAGDVRLLDVGSARPMCNETQINRMLDKLDETAIKDGAPRSDRLRFRRALKRHLQRDPR